MEIGNCFGRISNVKGEKGKNCNRIKDGDGSLAEGFVRSVLKICII